MNLSHTNTDFKNALRIVKQQIKLVKNALKKAWEDEENGISIIHLDIEDGENFGENITITIAVGFDNCGGVAWVELNELNETAINNPSKNLKDYTALNNLLFVNA